MPTQPQFRSHPTGYPFNTWVESSNVDKVSCWKTKVPSDSGIRTRTLSVRVEGSHHYTTAPPVCMLWTLWKRLFMCLFDLLTMVPKIYVWLLRCMKNACYTKIKEQSVRYCFAEYTLCLNYEDHTFKHSISYIWNNTNENQLNIMIKITLSNVY